MIPLRSHHDCAALIAVTAVFAWATGSTPVRNGGGKWATGGVAGDGRNPFVATGNTFTSQGDPWVGEESVTRFEPGPLLTDYWAPINWVSSWTPNLGGSGPLLVTVPGATPSSLVVALGKDGNAYLLDRSNLGGIGPPVASSHVNNSGIIQAAASYRTGEGTYVVFHGNSSTLSAFGIASRSRILAFFCSEFPRH